MCEFFWFLNLITLVKEIDVLKFLLFFSQRDQIFVMEMKGNLLGNWIVECKWKNKDRSVYL